MKRLATTAQMKELDRIAIEERKIPSLELMEHAASQVADRVLQMAGSQTDATVRIGIFCGAGNNSSLYFFDKIPKSRTFIIASPYRYDLFIFPFTHQRNEYQIVRILQLAGHIRRED